MSGWTIVTVRGEQDCNYDGSDYDGQSTYKAECDLAATADADDRVRSVRVENNVYLYMNMPRYSFDGAVRWLNEHSEMVSDAVVLGANDTTDTGTAKYYEKNDGALTFVDEYAEQQGEHFVGQKALAYITHNYDIVAKDPFHNRLDRTEKYLERGEVR